MKNQLDPSGRARSSELERVHQLLCRRTKIMPCSLGSLASADEAIGEGLAQRSSYGDVPHFLLACQLILALDNLA